MSTPTRAETAAAHGKRHWEVVVVGGGAAGLGAALVLARARRSVLVVDSGQPRNTPADGVHGYLGREGTSPRDLLAIGRAEVTGYGGEVVAGEVAAAQRLDDGRFRLLLADGSTVTAQRLLVTTGLVDELPPVPGLQQRWGRDVLHCPYCHGWEVRDRAVGVLATGPLAVHQALLWRQWSGDITLLQHTAPDFPAGEQERLAARGIRVVPGEVVGLEVDADRLTGVRLADGTAVAVQALAVATRMVARAGLLTGLGLATTPQEVDGHVIGEYLATDATGRTEVPGVWAAGNVTALNEQVIGAAAAGARAAAMINADLVEEEVRRAVDARGAAA
ncbi:NAD(P)/FAD-dependent oxidoreductase [Thermobifida alba]|uniref:NAD(P)/FAD-dependent oxidoreductase n=1 Tax=Thermobifida alba TaxID=53522 RepID=A0ABY4L2Q4_THEAE|nr:NAD(P)/FAD-dependent oxidoreductase [Thermobifida alba]UPT20525.1 NAD(P)/FAD-dependent oxidoreductase [Thermobifida alba]